MVQAWLETQGKWVYTAPLFSTAAILQQMAAEGTAFQQVRFLQLNLRACGRAVCTLLASLMLTTLVLLSTREWSRWLGLAPDRGAGQQLAAHEELFSQASQRPYHAPLRSRRVVREGVVRGFSSSRRSALRTALVREGDVYVTLPQVKRVLST